MIIRCIAATVVLAASSLSFSQVWTEVGDAEELLPGQTTVGTGTLAAITGTMDLDEVDLYAIRITDSESFRASTHNEFGTMVDTQLFLFDSSGFGVTHNDDDPDGTTLRSTITSQFLTGNGLYYLGISSLDVDPVGGILALEIWADEPWDVERSPDGLGANESLRQWAGFADSTGTYQIDLTGAEFAAVPEPASMAVVGLGVAALLRRRKKA